MALRTERFAFDAEIERLTAEMEQHAEQQAEYPIGSDGAQQAAQQGQQSERFRTGLQWAAEEWDATAVELAALTAGERNLVRDLAEQITASGGQVNAWIAVGTHDAPYLQHDPATVPDNPAAIKDTIAQIPALHPAFVDWAEARISDLSRMDGDTGKSYQELVLEKRASTSSTGEHG